LQTNLLNDEMGIRESKVSFLDYDEALKRGIYELLGFTFYGF